MLNMDLISKGLRTEGTAKTLEEILQEEVRNYNSTEGTETNCQTCKGKGYIMEIQKDEFLGPYTTVKECGCMRRKLELQKAKNSGIVPLLKKNFNNFETTNDWQKNIKALAIENAKTKTWFFIGGQSGAGKTHICSAITNHQSRNNVKVKYMVWTDDIRELKSFEDDTLMYQSKRVECLYIDDLFKKPKREDGLPNLTAADVDKTWELINFRYSNRLKTIISTELSIDDIIRIDESLGSRIKQNCGKYIINLSRNQERNYRLIWFTRKLKKLLITGAKL